MKWVDRNRIPGFVAAAFLLAFFLMSFTAMQSESDTWDEGLAIAADALRIFRGDWSIADYSPPLHTWLNAPAFHLLKPSLPPIAYLSGGESFYGGAFLYLYNDASAMLLVCRLSVLVVACVMGICLYRWSSRLGGPWAGVLAVFLMVLEPNVLTHSRIAAWDMLCTATMFIAAYGVWSWLETPSWSRAAAAGVMFGLALISKYTALILFPSLACGVMAHVLMKDKSVLTASFPKKEILQAALGLAIAAGVVILSYAPDFDPKHYFLGLAQVYSVNVPPESYQYYLLGRVYDQPVKYYYFVSFLIKTPISLILAISLFMVFRKYNPLSTRHDAFILTQVIWMFVSAAFDTYNICLRRILPVYPFLILYASQITNLAAPGWIRKTGMAVICGWALFAGVRTYPHHLSYFNEAACGSAAGIRHLDECNVDWGQGMPRLAEYLRIHEIAEVRMPPEDAGDFGRPGYYGVRFSPMVPEEYLNPKPAVYALSAHRVVWLKKQAALSADPRLNWMERFKPSGHVGYSIYIYDFRSP